MSAVVLITGASSGFGRVTAERLASQGMRVYGTSRRAPEDGETAGAYTLVRMDVDDEASVRRGVAAVIEREGRIDVVVNNAGIGIAGSIEDTSIEEAQRQMETNFFGTVRVIQAVLPPMRSQGSGTIINIGSIGGLIALPFQAFYSASKFGIEAITEALRHEVRPFGISVCCIEPGDFRTGMTDRRIFAERAKSSAYGETMTRVVDRYARDETQGADPVLVARLVERIIATRKPKARYLVGGLDQKAGAWLKRVLWYGLFERAFGRLYGL